MYVYRGIYELCGTDETEEATREVERCTCWLAGRVAFFYVVTHRIHRMIYSDMYLYRAFKP